MTQVNTKEEFKALIETIKNELVGYRNPIGFGIAKVDLGIINPEKTLQATYPVVNWNENFGSGAIFLQALAEQGNKINFEKSEAVFDINNEFIQSCMNAFNPYLEEAEGDSHRNVQVIEALYEIFQEIETDQDEYKICFIFDDEPVESVEAAYLKLYAISLGKAELRQLNLNGAFGILPNLAWTDGVPIELDWLRENEIHLKLLGEYPHIDFVDKFPRFLQHIIPADNTRILDTAKVRFGAQIAPGTTVMPGASYINFNAGTLGAVMVEGRISSSAIVGANSDVGGGASILGVLSGTDGNPISIGENTLLGANSVTGIPLGNACIIDAGVSILAGTKVKISAQELEKIAKANPNWIPVDPTNTAEEYIFKGKELAELNGIHFRQDSKTGEIIAMRSTREVKLNEELHT